MSSQPFYVMPFSSLNSAVGDDYPRNVYGSLGVMVSRQSTDQPIRLNVSGQFGPVFKVNLDGQGPPSLWRATVGIDTQAIGTKTFFSRPYLGMKFYKDVNLGLSRNSMPQDNWGAGVGGGFALVDQPGPNGPVIMRVGVTASMDHDGVYAGLNLELGGATMSIER